MNFNFTPFHARDHHHSHHQYRNLSHQSSFPLSSDDKFRQKIAEQNYKIVKSNKYPIDRNVETISEDDHLFIQSQLKGPLYHDTQIQVNQSSTIENAIAYHRYDSSSQICILNFADSTKPGGGYLNGRSPQEETLCRQTLLYPTLVGNQMYQYNIKNNLKVEGSDVMIYSPNVYVIRNDKYKEIQHPFTVNIISSPAVDNRKKIHNSDQLMESRIRKIINLAAIKQNDALILGAFGCGVFKNNPFKIARIFYQVLVIENMKNYFKSVIFPIFKSEEKYMIFRNVFYPKNERIE